MGSLRNSLICLLVFGIVAVLTFPQEAEGYEEILNEGMRVAESSHGRQQPREIRLSPDESASFLQNNRRKRRGVFADAIENASKNAKEMGDKVKNMTSEGIKKVQDVVGKIHGDHDEKKDESTPETPKEEEKAAEKS